MSDQNAINERDRWKHEYDTANENIRHYGTFLWAQITVFVAINAGLLAALFTLNPSLTGHAREITKCFGLLQSVCFALGIEATKYAWFHFANRAAELEDKNKLNYSCWSTMPGAPTT